MNSTAPLLVGFVRPQNSTDNTGSDFVVGAWIPDSFQNRAPQPRRDDESGEERIRVDRFSRETYFVSNWTGAPATAGTVAAKAEELAGALEENEERFHEEMAWMMSYRLSFFFPYSLSPRVAAPTLVAASLAVLERTAVLLSRFLFCFFSSSRRRRQDGLSSLSLSLSHTHTHTHTHTHLFLSLASTTSKTTIKTNNNQNQQKKPTNQPDDAADQPLLRGGL